MQNVIYKDDEEYPELLKQLGKAAPKQLYYKTRSENLTRHGLNEKDDQARPSSHNLPSSERKDVAHKAVPVHLFDNCLAVVGSRKLTHYGKQAIEKIVGEIVLSGITIVSGFMYGGDAAAHSAAVKNGGRTIAVMPCGIDLIHPQDQEKLYDEILENNGLIVSEYQGKMQPTLWTYPQRNRIVAGLSKAVLVAEAGEKSGSLITANLAKKFKRKLFALPGPITSSVSIGTNALIKQGAEIVTSAQDILKYFQDNNHRPCLDEYILPYSERKDIALKARPIRASRIEDQILDLLSREPLGADELSRELETAVSELGVKLSLMEMKGLIEQKGSKYYNRK